MLTLTPNGSEWFTPNGSPDPEWFSPNGSEWLPNSHGKVRTESLTQGWFAQRLEEARTYFN